MKLSFTKKEIAALDRAIELLKIEYQDCCGGVEECPPQAPKEFWDDLETAKQKVMAAKRKSQ